MKVRHLDGDAAELFLTHSPCHPLAACIGLAEPSGEPLRLTFDKTGHANVMVVGRSREAAIGICTTMLLDLASQIVTTPRRREIYITPPFSVLDFLGTEESRIFTDAAMSLPLPVKLERATDTEMNTLTDFQLELVRRQREPEAPWHPKFLFLCGLQAAHGIRSRGFYAEPDANRHASKFTQLLQCGTSQSLYTIVWCNSFANIELTMADGINSFDHLIVLDGAGAIPNHLPAAGAGSANPAWYMNCRQNSVLPIIPFAVPAGAWCDAVIRTFE